MAVRVCFEIGHEASVRTKRTPEGFTHDWEVFVRGIDAANISHFVDKVVFILHDTFPKPKRVVKEPPYTVKESGYAGFNLPIEIYLKNRDEPKKIKFHYDLNLQDYGAPILKVQKEKYVFPSPADDFKKKLLKGGGMIVTNPNPFMPHSNPEQDNRDSFAEEKPAQLIGKPKLSGDAAKKHRSKEYRIEDVPRPTNSFENLFGPPIHKTSKISPDPKKASPNPKSDKKDKEKSFEKDKNKPKEKEHKEEKVKVAKDEKRSKGHNEKERSKEKSKRPASPAPEPPVKRSPKRTSSPKPASSPSLKSNGSISTKDDIKPRKLEIPEVKKIKIEPDDPVKTDKKIKKEKKSYDREKEKIKREHRKESESKESKPKEAAPIKPKEPPKEIPLPVIKQEKERTPVKPEKAFNKFSIENMLKDPQSGDRSKHKNRSPGERKHKHKKKDKKHDESKEKHKEEKHREKKHKHDKHKEKSAENKEVAVEKAEIDKNALSKIAKEKERVAAVVSPISVDSQSNSRGSGKATSKSKDPLGSMIDALSASSNSEADISISDEENSDAVPKPEPPKVKQEPAKPPHESPVRIEKPPEKVTTPKEKSKKKEKASPGETKEERKQRKRKSSGRKDSPERKQMRLNEEEKIPPRADSSNGGRLSDASLRMKSDSKSQDSSVSSGAGEETRVKSESPDSEDASRGTSDLREMTPDYMMQLKDLQHRIMTIQSNDELERVVNLIAETGKYEVTKKTFDFDLCLLDRSTVQQLQELIGCESRA